MKRLIYGESVFLCPGRRKRLKERAATRRRQALRCISRIVAIDEKKMLPAENPGSLYTCAKTQRGDKRPSANWGSFVEPRVRGPCSPKREKGKPKGAWISQAYHGRGHFQEERVFERER